MQNYAQAVQPVEIIFQNFQYKGHGKSQTFCVHRNVVGQSTFTILSSMDTYMHLMRK